MVSRDPEIVDQDVPGRAIHGPAGLKFVAAGRLLDVEPE